MYYYWTIVCDLPTEEIVVLRPAATVSCSTKEEAELFNGHAAAAAAASGELQGKEEEDEIVKTSEEKKID